MVSFSGAEIPQDAGQFVGGNIRQKSQLAQIDGNHGQLPATHLMDRPQDRAIAAQHNGHVGVELGEVLGGVEIGGHDFGVRFDLRVQTLGLGNHNGPLRGTQKHNPQGAIRRRRGH